MVTNGYFQRWFNSQVLKQHIANIQIILLVVGKFKRPTEEKNTSLTSMATDSWREKKYQIYNPKWIILNERQ